MIWILKYYPILPKIQMYCWNRPVEYCFV